MRKAIIGLVVVTVSALAAGPALGASLAVTPDGLFKEWRKVDPAAADPPGDGRPDGIDLGRLFVADDGEALYFRLEVGRETILQNPLGAPAGNDLRLLLDLDNSVATGRPVEGLGVEVEVRFGDRRVLAYDAAGLAEQMATGSSGVMSFPTHSADGFELRVPFSAAGSPAIADRLASGGELSFFFLEEAGGGDRLPDAGALVYATSPESPAAVKPIVLAKKRSHYVRLLSFNAARSTIEREPEAYTRILRALQPDLIAFQEIVTGTAEETRRFVAEALPLSGGRRWQAFQVADTVTVSSFPILAGDAVDANSVVHVDLPDEETPHDLVLFNVHTPCCGNEAGRDREHDHLMATWRDLLEGVGPFTIGRRDAVVLAGDFNMVGFRRQLDVVLAGRFIDPANGPNFAPGRAKGTLRAPVPRHSHARRVHTWRRGTSEFGPGRLDYIFYGNDVARMKKRFVFDSGSLPGELLAELGLERDDSLVASDHLALVADFFFKRK